MVICIYAAFCESCFVQSGQYDAKYFLLYYYYGGMIYAALKNYERAVFFFENVSI